MITTKTFTAIKKEIDWPVLCRAVIALLPILIGYLWYGEPLLFHVALVVMSLFIVAERLKAGIYIIILHFCLIVICFSLLFFAFLQPYLFVLTCALMAFATIYFTQHGAKLRSLTNYTFIPVVYLTCEIQEGLAPAMVVSTYKEFMLLLPLALLIVCVLHVVSRFLMTKFRSKSQTLVEFWRYVTTHLERGEPESAWLQPALAIFLGVVVASAFVIFMHISRGEWVIWSTASVITINFADSFGKLKERLFGIFTGVPIGLLAGYFMPKTTMSYSLAVLGIMLTLIVFKRYRTGFACRCFLITLAAYIATASPLMALERVENVIIGGVIGVAAGYLSQLLFISKNRR